MLVSHDPEPTWQERLLSIEALTNDVDWQPSH